MNVRCDRRRLWRVTIVGGPGWLCAWVNKYLVLVGRHETDRTLLESLKHVISRALDVQLIVLEEKFEVLGVAPRVHVFNGHARDDTIIKIS